MKIFNCVCGKSSIIVRQAASQEIKKILGKDAPRYFWWFKNNERCCNNPVAKKPWNAQSVISHYIPK